MLASANIRLSRNKKAIEKLRSRTRTVDCGDTFRSFPDRARITSDMRFFLGRGGEPRGLLVRYSLEGAGRHSWLPRHRFQE
jgi:hypothetical protein